VGGEEETKSVRVKAEDRRGGEVCVGSGGGCMRR